MVENFLKLGGGLMPLLRRQKGFTTDINGIESCWGGADGWLPKLVGSSCPKILKPL